MTDVLRMHVGTREPVAALLVKMNAILTFLGGSGLRSIATLAIDVVPEKFKTTTTSVIQIAGVLYATAGAKYAPAQDAIDHYRQQVDSYRRLVGAPRGLVVFVTSGRIEAVGT